MEYTIIMDVYMLAGIGVILLEVGKTEVHNSYIWSTKCTA